VAVCALQFEVEEHIPLDLRNAALEDIMTCLGESDIPAKFAEELKDWYFAQHNDVPIWLHPRVQIKALIDLANATARTTVRGVIYIIKL
jgi:hypothetical protein